jgi:D-alanyl-D-alanine dipeptidase
MPSGYDEMTPRAHPDYRGGTPQERSHRDLLRKSMETAGFTVDPGEWWHFDYRDWRKYPILNLRFDQIRPTF